MFIIDDLLLAPARGFLWLARELQAAAEQEFADERDRTMRQLQSLHMRLEAGQIDEAEFDEQEAALLDRLDALDGHPPDDEPDPPEEDEPTEHQPQENEDATT